KCTIIDTYRDSCSISVSHHDHLSCRHKENGESACSRHWKGRRFYDPFLIFVSLHHFVVRFWQRNRFLYYVHCHSHRNVIGCCGKAEREGISNWACVAKDLAAVFPASFPCLSHSSRVRHQFQNNRICQMMPSDLERQAYIFHSDDRE